MNTIIELTPEQQAERAASVARSDSVDAALRNLRDTDPARFAELRMLPFEQQAAFFSM